MVQAAISAGYSESTAQVACREIMPHVRETFRQALHHRISVGKLSDTIQAGLDANETKFFQKDGMVCDQRDVVAWNERREYAKLAANLMALEPDKSMSLSGPDGGPIKVTWEVEDITHEVSEPRIAKRCPENLLTAEAGGTSEVG